METQKKHIEIHIKMDENEQIAPSSKISNVSGDDVIACRCGIRCQYRSRLQQR